MQNLNSAGLCKVQYSHLLKMARTSVDGEVHCLPSVQKMHGFLIIHSDNKVITKMWTNCLMGTLMASPLSVMDSPQSSIPLECYADHPRTLVEEKTAHMLQMYSRFIPPDRWPWYQADRSTTCACIQSWSITSRTSTFYKPTPLSNKRKKCSKSSCDGSGTSKQTMLEWGSHYQGWVF